MALPPLRNEADLPDGCYRVTSARMSYGRLILRIVTMGMKPQQAYGVKADLTLTHPPTRAILMHPLVDLAYNVPDDFLSGTVTKTREYSDADLKIMAGIRFTWRHGRARNAHFEFDARVQRFCEMFCRWSDRSIVAVREDVPGAMWRYRGKGPDPTKRFEFTLKNIEAHLNGERWYGLRASQTLFSQIDVDQHNRSDSTFAALVADILNALREYSFLMRTPRGMRVFIRWTRPQKTVTVNQYLARRLKRWQIGPTHTDGSPAFEIYPCETHASRLPFGKDQPIVTFDTESQTFTVVSDDWRKSLDIAEQAPCFSVAKYFHRNDRRLGKTPPQIASGDGKATPKSCEDHEDAVSTSSDGSGDPRPPYAGKDTKKWIELNAGWLQRQHPEWSLHQRLEELRGMGLKQRPTSRTIRDSANFDAHARPVIEFFAKTFIPPHGPGSGNSLTVIIDGIELTVASLTSRLIEKEFEQKSKDFYDAYLNEHPTFSKRMPDPINTKTWATIILKILRALKTSHGPIPRNFLGKLHECLGSHKAAYVTAFLSQTGIFTLSPWNFEKDNPSQNQCRRWTWNAYTLGFTAVNG